MKPQSRHPWRAALASAPSAKHESARTFGEHPMRAPDWSRDENAKLLALKKSELTVEQIAEHLPGRTPAAIRTHLNMLGVSSKAGRISITESDKRQRYLNGMRAPASAVRARSSFRPCMNCRNPFRSEGSHHRLCANCRSISVTPFEP